MVYGITGWSGGARVPVNYNLRAGQFRTGGFGYWGGNRTIINNFGCNHFMPPEPQCNHGFGVPKWMNIAFLGGMVMQGLGGIMSAIFGNRGGGYGEGYGGYSDGYGGMSAKDYDSLAALQRLYSGKYNIEKVGDEFVAVDKNGKQVTGKTISDLRAKLGGNTSSDDTPTISEKQNKELEQMKLDLYFAQKLAASQDKKIPYNMSGKYDGKNYILTYEKDGQKINVPCKDIDDFKEKADNVIKTGNHEDKKDNNANGTGNVAAHGSPEDVSGTGDASGIAKTGATATSQTAATRQGAGDANRAADTHQAAGAERQETGTVAEAGSIDLSKEPKDPQEAQNQLNKFNKENSEYAKANVQVDGTQFTYGGKTYGTLNEVKTAIESDITKYTLDANKFIATDGKTTPATKNTGDIKPKDNGLSVEYNDGTMNPPTTITVTTANGGQYTYTQNETETNPDDKKVYPRYTITSGGKEQEYILVNGQLWQYEGFNGYGEVYQQS